MQTKLLHTISIPALLIFAFGGDKSATDANAGGNNPANRAAKKRVGVTLLTREDDFYRELEAGLREAAAKNDFELIVQSGDKDLSKQQSQIDHFLVQKVDAIIVSPTDTKGIKIIKRKTSDGEQNEPPVAAQKKQSNPAKLQRETTTVITGWISDWRGRKQTDARAAFTDLFETSTI